MLAYESRHAGATVSLLSLTRGEGGQNVMTGDFWDSLGILRTQELLSSTRYDGVDLYFTRAADFGFSKTLDEALTQWHHDQLLADVVRVVRTTRPMVITSGFAGNGSAGHGHHQASGVMAQEAFTAAADPNRFPEQIREGLRPWKALKVYARVPFARVTGSGIYDYATGHTEPVRFRNYATGNSMDGVPSETLSIPEGTWDSLLGRTYLQIAREGLNQQKSQNGGVPIPAAGAFDVGYHLYASRVTDGPLPAHEDTFFDGIDTGLEGMAAYLPSAQQPALRTRLQAIGAQVDEAQRLFQPRNTTPCAAPIARGLHLTRELLRDVQQSSAPEDAKASVAHELTLKQQQFNDALAEALGLRLLATVQPLKAPPSRPSPFGPADPIGNSATAGVSLTATPGASLLIDAHLSNGGKEPVTITRTVLLTHTGAPWPQRDLQSIPGALAAGEAKDALLTTAVPETAALTRPYFTRGSVEQSNYTVTGIDNLSHPEPPYPAEVVATYTYNNTEAELRGTVQTAHKVLGEGVVLWPLTVAPAVSIRVEPSAGIIPLTATTLPLDLTVHSSVKDPANGTVTLQLPSGWTAFPPSAAFSTERDNQDTPVHFDITPRNLQAAPYTITASATSAGKTYTEGFQSIGYPGILPFPRYTAAQSRLRGVDLLTAPGLRVAYVMGTGDDVPPALLQMGIHPTMLTAEALAQADLRFYDAVVLGIRTYAARRDLRLNNDRLLRYVHDGGVVITQYQTPEYDTALPPYPIAVPGDAEKVVEEDAAVTLLKPEDPLFTWPNRISTNDFSGWVEERGHGFPRSFDPRYAALTSVHDAGQDPQTGGLIYARYGKGYYVYLAYAFFRQLPEGVPGPFRILSNLVSLGKNPTLPH